MRGEAVHAVRYAVTLYDALHQSAQLSDREYVAARRITLLWQESGIGGGVCAKYGEAPGRNLSDPDAVGAEDRYNTAMRALRPEHDARVVAMVRGEHPGWRLPELQAALGALADEWGIERDPDPAEDFNIEA